MDIFVTDEPLPEKLAALCDEANVQVVIAGSSKQNSSGDRHDDRSRL
jgi:hypothetical protein